MCELYGGTEQERKYARENLLEQAHDFDRFSAYLKLLATGRADPHSDLAKSHREKALALVRYLAREWI